MLNAHGRFDRSSKPRQHVQVGYTGIRRAEASLIEQAAEVPNIDDLREQRMAGIREENARYLRGER
jgi:hypothetical protein